jgi:phage tail protein X
MTAHYHIHITQEGDRWDLLAYRYYGDALRFEPIVAANPAVAITPVLSGGLTLYIPVLEVQPEYSPVPPWRQ